MKNIPSGVKLSPSFDLLLPSTKIIRDNIGVFFVLMIVPFVLANSILVFNIGFTMTTNPQGALTAIRFRPEFFVMLLISMLYSLLVLAPLTYAFNQTATGREVGLGEVFRKGLRYFWRLIWLNLFVGLLVIGGLILFIVPGIIMLRRYYLSQYYLVDKNLSIKEAMRRSAEQSKRFSGSIYGIIGVSMLIGFLSLVPFIGGYLSSVMQLLYAPAPALRYHEIKKAYL